MTYYHLRDGACLSNNDIIELHGIRYRVTSGHHGYFMENVDAVLENDKVFELLGITSEEKRGWAVEFGGVPHGMFPEFEHLEDLTRFVKAIIETPICSVGDVVEIKMLKYSESDDYPYGLGTIMDTYKGNRFTVERILESTFDYSDRKEHHGDIHIFFLTGDSKGYSWHSSMFFVIQRNSKVKLIKPSKKPQEISPKPSTSPQSRQEAPEGCIRINKPQQKFKTKIVL